MPKVRFVYAEPEFVPWLNRTVNPNQVVAVDAAQLPSFLEAASRWEPADAETKKLAAALSGADMKQLEG